MLLPTTPVHIVYRLRGSLPHAEVNRIKDTYREQLRRIHEAHQRDAPKNHPTHYEYRQARTVLEVFRFRQYDNLLDRCETGPRFLEDPALKRVILRSWAKLEELGRVRIYAISVMSNHVHVILAATEEYDHRINSDDLMNHHKRFTATAINRLRGTKGERVFAEFNYVRQIRPSALARVIRYVINNPVAAGLPVDPLQWCGSYLRPQYRHLFDGRAA